MRRHHVEANQDTVILGVELKSWYALAKERKATFRFYVNQGACALPDLVAVYPWALTNVLSGRPRIYEPFVAPAKWVAEYRNYFWEFKKKWKTPDPDKHKVLPPQKPATPYPKVRDVFNDTAVLDKGHNFGRIGRTGILDDLTKATLARSISGITGDAWTSFFRKCRGDVDESDEDDE